MISAHIYTGWCSFFLKYRYVLCFISSLFGPAILCGMEFTFGTLAFTILICCLWGWYPKSILNASQIEHENETTQARNLPLWNRDGTANL